MIMKENINNAKQKIEFNNFRKNIQEIYLKEQTNG